MSNLFFSFSFMCCFFCPACVLPGKTTPFTFIFLPWPQSSSQIINAPPLWHRIPKATKPGLYFMVFPISLNLDLFGINIFANILFYSFFKYSFPTFSCMHQLLWILCGSAWERNDVLAEKLGEFVESFMALQDVASTVYLKTCFSFSSVVTK